MGTYLIGKATYFNIGKDGNSQNKLAIYRSKCEACHAVDVQQILALANSQAPRLAKFSIR